MPQIVRGGGHALLVNVFKEIPLVQGAGSAAVLFSRTGRATPSMLAPNEAAQLELVPQVTICASEAIIKNGEHLTLLKTYG